MLYAFPQHIHPGNTAWLLGAILLWYFVLPSVMHCHWRMDVLRVQQLYSFAHAVAIAHVLTGRTKEWVATGSANQRTTPLAVTITRVMRTTVALTQASVWTGLVAATWAHGIQETWAVVCFGLLSAYVQLPMLVMRGKPKPSRAPAPVPVQRRSVDVLVPAADRVFTGRHPAASVTRRRRPSPVRAPRSGRRALDVAPDGPGRSTRLPASPADASPADATAELPTPAQLAAAQYARNRARRAERALQVEQEVEQRVERVAP